MPTAHNPGTPHKYFIWPWIKKWHWFTFLTCSKWSLIKSVAVWEVWASQTQTAQSIVNASDLRHCDQYEYINKSCDWVWRGRVNDKQASSVRSSTTWCDFIMQNENCIYLEGKQEKNFCILFLQLYSLYRRESWTSSVKILCFLSVFTDCVSSVFTPCKLNTGLTISHNVHVMLV